MAITLGLYIKPSEEGVKVITQPTKGLNGTGSDSTSLGGWITVTLARLSHLGGLTGNAVGGAVAGANRMSNRDIKELVNDGVRRPNGDVHDRVLHLPVLARANGGATGAKAD